MFSISKGEPPTPPSTTANPSTAEMLAAPREHSQVPKRGSSPIRTLSAPTPIESTSTNQPATEICIAGRSTARSFSLGRDSGFEASPCSLNDRNTSRFPILTDGNDFDDVFDDYTSSILLEREVVDDWCPDCDDVSSCSCSRAESSATVRAAMTGYTDPNTCDSDSSSRSSSPQSPPPPSSWPIPASCNHMHSDRLPCPACSGRESSEMPTSPMSYLHNMVSSRSYPGSYPTSLLHWWNQSPPSAPELSARVAAALRRASSRSDDRRSTRSRRRLIDSDASSISSLSCDEHIDDEVFASSCEGGVYLDELGSMAEAEELRVNPPEDLPDIVPLPTEATSRRVRSQSVSIPLDHDYLREIGISLRRLSNDFENRLAERNRQRRRSSLAQYFYW